MSVRVCKRCGCSFEYCRACVFKPIYYKDDGYCSKECYEASKNKIKEVVLGEDVEVVSIDEDTSTQKEEAIECPHFFATTDNESKEVPANTAEIDKPKKRKNRIVNEIIEENNTNENEQDYGENVLGK